MSAAIASEAETMVIRGIRKVDPDLRSVFLRELVKSATAALQVYHGPELAAEVAYQAGDLAVAASNIAGTPRGLPCFAFRAKPLRP